MGIMENKPKVCGRQNDNGKMSRIALLMILASINTNVVVL
jgi:hypothetical protein